MSGLTRAHSSGRRKRRAFDGWLTVRVCHWEKGTGLASAKESQNYTGKLLAVPFSIHHPVPVRIFIIDH